MSITLLNFIPTAFGPDAKKHRERAMAAGDAFSRLI
jgi:hypothetical protein